MRICFSPILKFIFILSLPTTLAFGQSIPTSSAISPEKWSAANLADFEASIEKERKQNHIPGLSVGIVYGNKLIWKKGFGFADIDNKQMPDEYTVYQIASVTKTFSSILLMQQVEAGKASLEDPIAKYKINLGARWGSDERIKVKHLLTHTAMGSSMNGFKPGYQFKYNGDWYNRLKDVIEQSSGRSFGMLLLDSILKPLGLKETVPSTDDSVNFSLTGKDKTAFQSKVAKPYDWQNKQIVPIVYHYHFGPAAGIMSSVHDLAQYSMAIDENKFIDAQTWQHVFTPFKTPKGKTIQYGLGWFVGYHKGLKLLWHNGWWTGYSALFVKIPEKDLTLIILANSQDLTRPFMTSNFWKWLNPFDKNLNKNLLASDFAASFYNHFVK
jgi:CubicO group peptidase (beta-lactamase class C family)